MDNLQSDTLAKPARVVIGTLGISRSAIVGLILAACCILKRKNIGKVSIHAMYTVRKFVSD